MTDVIMPQMGESIAEGTIAVWLVEVGGYVEADQPLVQVTTDKADVDIPSPASGILAEVLAEEGATVPIGQLIARIDETAAMQAGRKPEEMPEPVTKKPAGPAEGYTAEPPLVPEKKPEPPLESKKEGPAEHPFVKEGVPAAEELKPAAGEKPIQPPPVEIVRPEAAPGAGRDMSRFYSPAVMRLGLEMGIDVTKLKGTGEGGRVTKSDVLNADVRHWGELAGAAQAPLPSREDISRSPLPSREGPGEGDITLPSHPAGFGAYKPPVYEVEPDDTEMPFSRLRRLIADHMVYSKATSAHVTTFAEVDLDRIVGIRDTHKARIKDDMGISLTFLPFVMLAAIRALNEYPLMNSVVQGDTILIKKRVNMGVAVDSERGLMVPVIKGAEGLSLIDLAKSVNDLSIRVRDRKILPDEMSGGTFTVTNPGRKGNLFGTPIISQPQVGILRMGEVVKRAVVVEHEGEDAIAIRPMMYLSLSYDHRVVDGLTANEFLHRIREHLEEGAFEL
ncbi:MAG: 2-oxo acid dehydrogenase subunit E2 [Nitrospirae bacterium]|nr:2-oxo acid dehydrogenase subunit E2 [Nitrospirota bacterium]